MYRFAILLSMTTAFLLGSTPSLSMAELESVFCDTTFEKEGNIAYSSAFFHQVQEKFYELGGVSRAFEILSFDLEIFDILLIIKKYISSHAKGGKKMKIAFFAQHPAFAKRNFMKWMQEIKNFSKQKNISLRIVNRGDQNLDANAVDKEKLLEQGNAEFAIAEKGGRFVLMRTISVQQVWKFITRDIKKPVRDMQVGMLPPKLARMMINLSRNLGILPKKIYDPFCGTGTVLLESMDLGIKCVGSDLSENMVEASQKNTDWFAQLLSQNAVSVFQKDAAKAFSKEQKNMISSECTALVAEGYLGHIYSHPLSDADLKKEYVVLFPLYSDFLKQITASGLFSDIVFGFPFWKTQKGKFSFVMDLLKEFPQWKSVKTLRYLRDDQNVGREIVKLVRTTIV